MRLKVRASFVAYLAAVALLASPQACAGAVLALSVHELAHLLAGKSVGERFDRVELTPFGGVITGGSCASGWRGALVAAAGPLGNYAALLALASPALLRWTGEEFIRQAMLANAVMMAFNLLPALPLDGGRIAYCLLSGVTGVSRAIACLSSLGVVLGATLACASAFGLARWGFLNLSALITGGYLAFSAAQTRTSMIVQNLTAVIRERQSRGKAIRRVRLYETPSSLKTISLAALMESCEEALFLTRLADGTYLLEEDDVCRALLDAPQKSVCEIAELCGKKLDTATKNASAP